MYVVRRSVCSAVIIVWDAIFGGASESGTGGCVIFIFDTLVCRECIGGASVSGRVVVIYGSEVIDEAIDCCCRDTGQWWVIWLGRLLSSWPVYVAVYRLGICDLVTLCMGSGCSLVGGVVGEGFGMQLGSEVCGSTSGVGFLEKMSSWI